MDRLSSLPDDNLVDIISLLPTKLAVSTSVLSSRWHNLWTHITSVHIDCYDFNQPNPNFFTIVDHLLLRLTSPFIRTFRLYVRNLEQLPLNPRIGSWFQLLSARRVESIKILNLQGGRVSCADGPTVTLPLCLFQTQSLCELELSPGLNYKLRDFDNNVVMNLPNLIKIDLNVGCASACRFVSKLTRHCPSLQQLFLHEEADDWDENCVVDISCPTLKVLVLDFLNAPETTRVIIDAPQLDTFSVFGTLMPCCSFVKKPIALREAKIFTINQVLLLRHVKIIVLNLGRIDHANHLLNFAKYLLTHAPVLDRLVFFGSQAKEVKFRQELIGYPRSSPHCQIQF